MSAFRPAQSCRARTRVDTLLGGGGLARRFMQQSKTRLRHFCGVGGYFRKMAARPRQGAGAPVEEGLHPAVFERMEGDHGETAAGTQHAFAGGETQIELAEFVIDVDAERLITCSALGPPLPMRISSAAA